MPEIRATNAPMPWPIAAPPSSLLEPGNNSNLADGRGAGNRYSDCMAMNKLHTMVAVIGIAIVGAAAWWWQQRGGGAVAPKEIAGAAPAAANAASGAVRGGGGGGGGGAGGPGAGPAAVELGKVEVVRIEDDAQAVGSLRAVQTVIVRPEVSGRIVRLGFTDGGRVRKGQLLVQLDNTLQDAQLKQAQAQANIARTNLQRSRELQAQNFVSQSAVDQNAAALEVAQAQVALARAQLSRLAILSPFDGSVGIRSVALGDYVKDGADLVSLEDRSSMWVDFRLPERFVAQAKPGQAVEVSLDAMSGKPLAAKVEALDALVDANGRSLLVRARLEQPGAELKSGMFARARIVFAVRERALMVPEEALVPQGGKQYLVKAVAASAAGASAPANGDVPGDSRSAAPPLVSQRIEARLGVRQAGKVEILEGLKPGEMIVTAGQARVMRDGVPLRVIDLDKPALPVGKPPGGASAPRAAAPA
jgi:membrane fusion protein, multidrug efflux system